MRIGPRVGNATSTCPGLDNVYVQSIAPLGVYGQTSIYWDASSVAVAYIPPVFQLVVNVTFINVTGEVKPLPGTLVEVTLVYTSTGKKVVYGVNADSSGVARIPVPFEKAEVLEVNLTIRDTSGNVVWAYTYTYDPRRLGGLPQEVELPTATIPVENVDKRSAARVYGTPPFLQVSVDFVDLARAPGECTKRGSADFYLKPSVRNLFIVKGEKSSEVNLIYVDPDEGFLELLATTPLEGVVSAVSKVRDYVGYGVDVAATGTYSDGGYLVVGLMDGRLRMYAREGGVYKLRDIYTMGSPLVNLVMVPGVTGYTYVVVSTSGVQVLRIDPYPLPVYRNLVSLSLATPGYVHGDSTADLSAIALIDQQSLTIVKNSDLAVKNKLVLTASGIMAKDIELVLNAPRGEDLSDTRVILRYPGGVVEYRVSGNRVTLKNIIPRVNYTVEVYPLTKYIHNCSFTFTLRENQQLEVLGRENAFLATEPGSSRLVVNLTYVMFTVKLNISDDVSGPELVAPLDIYVDGALVAEATRSTVHALKLIYGEHNIEVRPSRGYENVYDVYSASITVDRDIEESVQMKRTRYSVVVNVVDTFKSIASPLEISVEGPVSERRIIEPPGAPLVLQLPYGDYVLSINPSDPSVYSPYTTTFSVTAPRVLNVVVQRIAYKVEVNVEDKLGVIGKFELYANGTKIADNLGKRSVVEIPYGVYELRLAPMPAWADAYEPSKPVIATVTSDTSVTIPVNRRVYKLRIVALEGGEPVSNVATYIYSAETGELITVLPTDTNGVVETSVPFGVYRVVLRHEKYNEEVFVTTVNKDTSEVVSMRPTLITVFWRYMPVIGVLVGVAVALYIALKVRARIAERLAAEELF